MGKRLKEVIVDENADTFDETVLVGYEETLNEWKSKSKKIAFIYDYVGDTYRKSLDRTSIVSFVLTACASLLALGNLGLKDADHQTVAIVLKGISAVLAVSATITTGLPRILNWNHTLEASQKYLDTVEHLISTITSEQSLPMKFRTEPSQFILQNKERFGSVLNSAPQIKHDDYVAALTAYDQQKMRLRYELVQPSQTQLSFEVRSVSETLTEGEAAPQRRSGERT